jgi:hypothetical protein
MQQQPECTEHEPAQGDNGVIYCKKCNLILPQQERPRRKRVERAETEANVDCTPKLTLEQRIERLEVGRIPLKSLPPDEPKPKIKPPMNPLLKWALIVIAAIILINVAQVMLCGYQIGG